MFFRNIGLSLVLGAIMAFAAAAVAYEPGGQARVTLHGKRQDRLVPAGGFKPRQHSDAGYGIEAMRGG